MEKRLEWQKHRCLRKDILTVALVGEHWKSVLMPLSSEGITLVLDYGLWREPHTGRGCCLGWFYDCWESCKIHPAVAIGTNSSASMARARSRQEKNRPFSPNTVFPAHATDREQPVGQSWCQAPSTQLSTEEWESAAELEQPTSSPSNICTGPPTHPTLGLRALNTPWKLLSYSHMTSSKKKRSTEPKASLCPSLRDLKPEPRQARPHSSKILGEGGRVMTCAKKPLWSRELCI